ncbi:hypothetical protein DSC45_03730 [Streptomyces sp. YIM 130001]|nr:hypothetical protein DSC45_03730 [Streptomyces sp. YIM 130001]
MSRSPRRPCPVCKRSIAVVGGMIWRHDPPESQRAKLTSCDGSWERPTDPCPGQLTLDVPAVGEESGNDGGATLF